MKRYFLTGLAILLPAFLTFVIVVFLLNLLTDPFINGIEALLNYYQVQGHKTWSLSDHLVLRFIVRLFILVICFLFIILIGFLTRTLFLYSLITTTDKFLHRIPVFNKIYKSFQEVIHTLFSSKGNSFKQVVLVPYPHEDSLSLGFVTTDITAGSNDPKLKNLISVFVPGTPNPTFGFIIMFPKDQVKFTSMKVEEAFKILVSCGIMLPTGLPNDKT